LIQELFVRVSIFYIDPIRLKVKSKNSVKVMISRRTDAEKCICINEFNLSNVSMNLIFSNVSVTFLYLMKCNHND